MSQDQALGVGYDDTHRAFLQALLARQTITFEEARPILARILTVKDGAQPVEAQDISREDFEQYKQSINDAVSAFDFELRSTKHQESKAEVFAFVNTTSDAFTQLSTVHSADEIAFVRRVLDAIFETYNTAQAEVMAITSIQALKLAKPPHNNRRDSGTGAAQAVALTQTQAQSMLDDMVSEGWFERSQRGYYTLTPRALMELREWLVDTYNDDEEEDEPPKIKFCTACKDIVTIGQRCPEQTCNGRLHNHCTSRMFRAQGGQQACPLCKSPWTDPLPVGQKAATRHSQGSSQHRRSNANVVEDDGSD